MVKYVENIDGSLTAVEDKPKESFSQDGYSEVVNFSFTDDELFHELTKVEILNPISQDSKFLRSSLIPSLLKNASYNFNLEKDAWYAWR